MRATAGANWSRRWALKRWAFLLSAFVIPHRAPGSRPSRIRSESRPPPSSSDRLCARQCPLHSRVVRRTLNRESVGASGSVTRGSGTSCYDQSDSRSASTLPKPSAALESEAHEASSCSTSTSSNFDRTPCGQESGRLCPPMGIISTTGPVVISQREVDMKRFTRTSQGHVEHASLFFETF